VLKSVLELQLHVVRHLQPTGIQEQQQQQQQDEAAAATQATNSHSSSSNTATEAASPASNSSDSKAQLQQQSSSNNKQNARISSPIVRALAGLSVGSFGSAVTSRIASLLRTEVSLMCQPAHQMYDE
jgi:hypothetical protein